MGNEVREPSELVESYSWGGGLMNAGQSTLGVVGWGGNGSRPNGGTVPDNTMLHCDAVEAPLLFRGVAAMPVASSPVLQHSPETNLLCTPRSMEAVQTVVAPGRAKGAGQVVGAPHTPLRQLG